MKKSSKRSIVLWTASLLTALTALVLWQKCTAWNDFFVYGEGEDRVYFRVVNTMGAYHLERYRHPGDFFDCIACIDYEDKVRHWNRAELHHESGAVLVRRWNRVEIVTEGQETLVAKREWHWRRLFPILK